MLISKSLLDIGACVYGNILCDRTENGHVCPPKCSSLDWLWILDLHTHSAEKGERP